MKKVNELSEEKKVIDTDSTMVIGRGKEGRPEVKEGKGEVSGDVRRCDLG